MALSRSPRCAFCNSSNEGHLSRCAACSVVHYCSRDHQVAHRDAHKGVCNGIKKALQVLEKEETKLRAHPGDWMTPPNLFEDSVGHFWGIHETRPYMRSRYAVVEAYLAIDTYAAVEAARSHLADMLRLCRGDNMGVRDLVPATLLRLGRDQECYDFVGGCSIHCHLESWCSFSNLDVALRFHVPALITYILKVDLVKSR